MSEKMVVVCNHSEPGSVMPSLIFASSGIALDYQVHMFFSPGGAQALLKGELEKIGQPSVFEQVLQRLPVTLVHGDVHPGNIIRSPEGESVLIDWGNARIAPAMLDLANVVTLGSDSWAAYFSTWEKAGGPPLDPAQIRREYDWAVAMVNLQYLPFAAAYRNENVPKMVERILDARDRLKA